MKLIRQISMKKIRLLAILLVLCCLLPLGYKEEYQGATSYDNAKEFYDSVSYSKKAEAHGGDFYMGTMAKLASSSSNLRYKTLGFDITLSGSGYNVSFSVARGSSIELLEYATRTSGEYEYSLYRIPTKTLRDLAFASNPRAAQQIFSGTNIKLIADAIITTHQNGTVHGSIAENGSGGLYKSGSVYHLGNSSDLSTMKSIFSGHKFESYTNIDGNFDNYQLSILYSLDSGTSLNSGYSSQIYTAGSLTVENALHANGSIYMPQHRVFQEFFLLNPADVGLKKTGYHLDSGREWVTGEGYIYTHTQAYMPKDLNPNVAYQNAGTILYANWKANTYTVSYDANGGSGAVMPTTMTYDTETALRNNTFTKTGYYLEEGKEWIDANGNTYASNQVVSNLTDANGVTLTLYANWKPIIAPITLNKQGGSGGADMLYEKYDTCFFTDTTTQSSVSKISVPSKTGYNFTGYYASITPGGPVVIDSSGTIKVPNNYFIKDAVLYAAYEPKTYTITFDKQGGSGGTDSVTTVYDEVLPFAEAPVKKGASFKGYYTQPNGQGTMYYNEFMASDVIYRSDANTTLYAYWLDETAPEAYLTANNNEWTNRTITLNASATDHGSGLSSVILYKDGVVVAQYNGLNGVMNKTFIFNNNKQGVVVYRLVATDMRGNTAEVQRPVYYDIKAPTGAIVSKSISGNSVFFRVNVTDINVQ